MVYNVNLGRTELLDIDKITNAEDYPNNINEKPLGGLWGCRPDAKFGWEDWCACEMPHWLSVEHAEVEVNDNAKVLEINSGSALRNLMSKYKEPSALASEGLIKINWGNVAKDYDIVEFTISNNNEVQRILRTIDCDSAVILNKQVITNILNPSTVTLRSEATTIEIDPNTTQIEKYKFSGYTNVKTVNIPEGITKIGHGAFDGCKSLENIQLPSTLKEIEWSAFAECDNLKKVVLPNNIETLDKHSFDNNTSVIFMGHDLTSAAFVDNGIDIKTALDTVKKQVYKEKEDIVMLATGTEENKHWVEETPHKGIVAKIADKVSNRSDKEIPTFSSLEERQQNRNAIKESSENRQEVRMTKQDARNAFGNGESKQISQQQKMGM